ncbi:hypothetical protein C2E23DRAFT_818312 [Lenzites betulinus]|nr:hypothetical protein C2E23DRAFT_818312 [Lenzites betulinus]
MSSAVRPRWLITTPLDDILAIRSHVGMEGQDILFVRWNLPQCDSLALIPHPVLGPGAPNAVVPYRPTDPRLSLPSRTASTSTALIPHPIYGPGAQNALVPYRPPTPWASTREAIVPPNSPAVPLSPPPPYDSDFSDSESGSSFRSYYSADHGSFSDEDDFADVLTSSDDSDDSDEYVQVRAGDSDEFPIYVDSDSDSDDFEGY